MEFVEIGETLVRQREGGNGSDHRVRTDRSSISKPRVGPDLECIELLSRAICRGMPSRQTKFFKCLGKNFTDQDRH